MSRSALGVFKFPETTGPTEAKFHVAPPWDWGKDGKPIQIIKLICCYSLLSSPGPGTFSRGFATNLASHRAFSSALKIEKLKAPLIPGSKGGGGAGDTNDWWIHVSKGFFNYTLLSGALIKWILCHVIAFSEDKAGMLRLHNLRATRRIKRI